MLKINDLHVSYGQIKALKGISLNVEQGQIVTLIGANGAGKSTLLKTISSLLKPTEGEILYEGTNIVSTPSDKVVERGIIHVPEGRRIFSGMSVYENIMLGAYQNNDKKNIQETLQKAYDLFPILYERRNQDAQNLSGGEQQMLAISRALMSNPKLMILDEPSMGLAPLIVKQIFELIKTINNQGITILLVEQNAKRALEISDYAYIIESGLIKLEGPAIEIRNMDKVKEIYLGK